MRNDGACRCSRGNLQRLLFEAVGQMREEGSATGFAIFGKIGTQGVDTGGALMQYDKLMPLPSVWVVQGSQND